MAHVWRVSLWVNGIFSSHVTETQHEKLTFAHTHFAQCASVASTVRVTKIVEKPEVDYSVKLLIKGSDF